MNAIVDLIYVKYPDRYEMSCAVTGDGKDKLIGPVDGKEAIKNLAPELQQHLPDRFPSIKDAETQLMMIHFRNISAHQNSAGQSYPYELAK